MTELNAKTVLLNCQQLIVKLMACVEAQNQAILANDLALTEQLYLEQEQLLIELADLQDDFLKIKAEVLQLNGALEQQANTEQHQNEQREIIDLYQNILIKLAALKAQNLNNAKLIQLFAESSSTANSYTEQDKINSNSYNAQAKVAGDNLNTYTFYC